MLDKISIYIGPANKITRINQSRWPCSVTAPLNAIYIYSLLNVGNLAA